MKSISDVISEVIDVLERFDIPYLVGGSFASSVWGQPRQTNDLDLAVQVDESQVDSLVQAFAADYMVSGDEIRRTLSEREEYRSFQLFHIDAGFKVDVFVPQLDAYRRSEFLRAKSVELIPGVLAICSAAENVVIQKIRWYVLGNRVSDRQWNDIVQVLEIQKGQLDEEYMFKWASHFGVDELLREAMSQTLD